MTGTAGDVFTFAFVSACAEVVPGVLAAVVRVDSLFQVDGKPLVLVAVGLLVAVEGLLTKDGAAFVPWVLELWLEEPSHLDQFVSDCLGIVVLEHCELTCVRASCQEGHYPAF